MRFQSRHDDSYRVFIVESVEHPFSVRFEKQGVLVVFKISAES